MRAAQAKSVRIGSVTPEKEEARGSDCDKAGYAIMQLCRPDP